MDSTSKLRRDELARYVPAIGLVVIVAVAVPLGIVRGLPGVVLWLAFGVLSGAVLLFWEAARIVLDPTAPGDATAEGTEHGVPAELETRKRAALRALRDIEYERAIQRLSEEDYKVLEARYRAEARAAMRAIDDGVSAWMGKAEELMAKAERKADKGSAPVAKSKTTTTIEAGVCPKCATRNDADATFCKRCGVRVSDA